MATFPQSSTLLLPELDVPQDLIHLLLTHLRAC